MTAELINLRRVKKQMARGDAEKLADANRIKFGRSKQEKNKTIFENTHAHKLLDGKKRDS
jgi:Domain of unknown function (DUF4169)